MIARMQKLSLPMLMVYRNTIQRSSLPLGIPSCWRRVGVFLLAVVTISLSQALADQPNVLFIAADDLRNDLNCYGATHVSTPNFDRLAETSLVFDRAYCQQAVCHPSRASLMTGKLPDTIGVTNLYTDLRVAAPNVVTLPQHFRKHGYVAESYGKIFHAGHGHNGDPGSWSVPPHRFKRGEQYVIPENRELRSDNRAKLAEAEAAGKSLAGPKNGPAFERAADSYTEYRDGAMILDARNGLKRLAEGSEPFFLAVGFSKPHLPFNAPEEYWKLYDGTNGPKLPDNPYPPRGVTQYSMHTNGELRSYSGVPWSGNISDELTLDLRQGYYACVSYIDSLLGDLLTDLDTLGLRDNTVIVFWSDHGFKLGEHGLWHKHTNFELDCRVPFMISAPGYRDGNRSGSLVELVDIFPTLCDLAGLPIPRDLEGMSLLPVLENPKHAIRPYAQSQYPRGRNIMGYAIKTDRFRYVEWTEMDSGEVVAKELYDHYIDVAENINQADNPSYRSELPRLSAWVKESRSR
jgi:iduronate 2-sulfatase